MSEGKGEKMNFGKKKEQFHPGSPFSRRVSGIYEKKRA